MAQSCFATPVCRQRILPDLRKVTSDKTQSSFIASLDVDSYIKDVDRVEPLA